MNDEVFFFKKFVGIQYREEERFMIIWHSLDSVEEHIFMLETWFAMFVY